MNQSRKKALIIGCGIAGPAIALFLQRAGIEAEIYEARASAIDYGGLFLNMACNGLDVLKELGLDEQVSSQGSPIPRMMIWSGNGKRLGEVRNGARAEVGAPSINLLRARLHQTTGGNCSPNASRQISRSSGTSPIRHGSPACAVTALICCPSR